MRDEATADRVELVSGRKELETWKEMNASALPMMFKIFRKELAAQLTTRFQLDVCPNRHVLLALKMNPAINTSTTSLLFTGKSAMGDLMNGEYKRALRRQCQNLLRDSMPVMRLTITPTTELPTTPAGATAVPDAVIAPEPKRRKGLLGAVAAKQNTTDDMPDVEISKTDAQVQVEIERFSIISEQIIAQGEGGEYYQGNHRINLRAFWADHKRVLPLHYNVYLAEVGCKKSAAANVESVFSGAGKFTDEAGSAGHVLLPRIVRLHYNWKYDFLCPTVDQVVDRYMAKFQPNVHAQQLDRPAASPTESPGTAPA